MNSLSLRVLGSRTQDDHKLQSKGKMSVMPVPDKYRSTAKGTRYAHDVDNLYKARNIDGQLKYIRSVAENLMTDDGKLSPTEIKFVMNLMCELYWTAPLKHPVKNTIARIFTKMPQHGPMISKELANVMTTAMARNDNIESFEDFNNVISSLNGCFDNFPVGLKAVDVCFNEVFTYLYHATNAFVRKLSEDMSPACKSEIAAYIHNAVRALVSCLQQCEALTCSDTIEPVCMFYRELLGHCDLAMETKGNCGIVVLLISRRIHEAGFWIKVLYDAIEANSDTVKQGSVLVRDTELLCWILGVITTVPSDELCSNLDAMVTLSRSLVDIGERSNLEAALILGVTRAILQLTRKLIQVPEHLTFDVTRHVRHLAWGLLEHSLDAVRHAARSIIDNCVTLAKLQIERGYSTLLDDIIIETLSFPEDRIARYISLSVLCGHIGCKPLLHRVPGIVGEMLESVQDTNMSRHVCQCFETLMQKHNSEVSRSEWLSVWVTPLIQTLSESPSEESPKRSTAGLDILLEKTVRLQPQLVDSMASSLCDSKNPSTALLLSTLTCLSVGRRLGVFDKAREDPDQHKWKGVLTYSILQDALVHQDDKIRLSALALLSESHKSTEIFTWKELWHVTWYLRYNINTQAPATRQTAVAILKKLLTRLKDSYQLLIRNIENITAKLKEHTSSPTVVNEMNKELTETKTIQKQYQDFVLDLRHFCFENLFPGANFSRRGVCLQLLVICQDILQDFLGEDVVHLWTIQNAQILLKGLNDTYESNKELVIKLLSQCPPAVMQLQNTSDVKQLLDLVLLLANSVHPMDCLTAAYYLLLLVRIDATIEALPVENCFKQDVTGKLVQWLMGHAQLSLKTAQKSLLVASAKQPLYGILLCIRYLLANKEYREITKNPEWKIVFDALIKMCFEMNDVVSPIVNNSSPEGHLPCDLGVTDKLAQLEISDTDTDNSDLIENIEGKVTAQMVLLCAWRTVKEVSLLLGDISYNASVDEEENDSESYLITKTQLLNIGEHFTKLLSETKHRGAFEQAYVGFSKLCARLWKTKNVTLSMLPLLWLHELLRNIEIHNENSKLCATRRSAGVPFMVQALVTTELQHCSNPTGFPLVMSTLLAILNSSESTLESRTHSLNILRALVRHSTLGDLVAPHVSDLIVAAVNGFGSNTWAERNASTLLFSALITRVFGVQRTRDSEKLNIRNKMTGRIFFFRYPKLYDFILNQLMVSSDLRENYELHPSLFPILLLLSRLYPSALEGTESNLKLVSYIPLVLHCSASRVLPARQLAARAMVALVMPDQCWSHVAALLSLLAQPVVKENANMCHGMLLQLVYAVKHIPLSLKWPCELFDRIIWGLENTVDILPEFNDKTTNVCLISAEVYAQFLILIAARWHNQISKQNTLIWSNLDKALSKPTKNTSTLGKSQYEKTLFQLRLYIKIIVEHNNLTNTIVEILIQGMQHASCEVVNAVLDIILCLFKVGTLCNDSSDDFEVTFTDKMFVVMLNEQKHTVREALHSSEQFPVILSEIISKRRYVESVQKSYCVLSLFPSLITIVIGNVRLGNSDTFESLIDICLDEIEVISHTLLKCLDSFLTLLLDLSGERHFSDATGERLIELLFKSISSENTYEKRHAVALFIIHHWHLLMFGKTKLLSDKSTALLWVTVMNLLSDDDRSIRNTVCHLVNYIPVFLNHNSAGLANKSADSNFRVVNCASLICAERSLVQLLHNIPANTTWRIALWVGLALQENNSEDHDDTYENRIFDKGEMNIYHEQLSMTYECSKELQGLFSDCDKINIRTKLIQTLLIKDVLTFLITITNSNIVFLIGQLIENIENKELCAKWASLRLKGGKMSEIAELKMTTILKYV